METRTVCLHQFARPDRRLTWFRKAPHGDCRTCKPDPSKNGECPGYVPVTVSEFRVRKKMGFIFSEKRI